MSPAGDVPTSALLSITVHLCSKGPSTSAAAAVPLAFGTTAQRIPNQGMSVCMSLLQLILFCLQTTGRSVDTAQHHNAQWVQHSYCLLLFLYLFVYYQANACAQLWLT